MFRKILVLLFLVSPIFALAQKDKPGAKVKFAMKAGLNLNYMKYKDKDLDTSEASNLKLGYNVGATVDFGFTKVISFQMGLFFNSKGQSLDLDNIEYFEKVEGYSRTSLNYIEIPMNFVYKFKRFQVYTGPYFAIGVGGKNKYDYTYTYNNEVTTQKGEFRLKPVFGVVGEGDLGDDEGGYYGLDYGLNFGIGYQVGNILFNAGYSLGLGNITPDYEGSQNNFRKNNPVYNRLINFSVSYFFGK